MAEEDLPDQFPAAADTDCVEDGREMLLDDVDEIDSARAI
jgi:hypothetical protein